MADPRDTPDTGDDGNSEPDADKLARIELTHLQRQYRQLEMERLEYSIQSGSNKAAQHPRVICYERERDELLTDLVNVLSERSQKADEATVEVILDLLAQLTAHQTSIEYQFSEISELDEQVKKITKNVIQQKIKVQATFGRSKTLPQSQKHQQVLENRLYRFTTNFDSQLARNAAARRVINFYLMERRKFHDKYRSMKRGIVKMKRRMYDLVDIATSTYDQREDCVTKMKALRERNDKESRVHIQEMKEYHHLLHNDEKARAFMEAKCKIRIVLEEDHVRLERHQFGKEKYYDGLLKSYRKGFQDILTMANCTDVQSLLRIYLAQENRNFTNFRHLSTLNSELDFIKRAVTELRSVIEVKVAEHKRMQSDQLKSLKLLENELEDAIVIRSRRKDDLKKSTMDLNMMLESLQNIFQVAKCDQEPIMRFLVGGRTGKILPENVELCMTLLEKKIQEQQSENKILQIRKAVEVDNAPLPNMNKRQTEVTMTSRRPMGGFIKPKYTTRLDPGDGEDQEAAMVSFRPLTYDEIRAELVITYRLHTADTVKREKLSTIELV